jgi:hypothetical protein
MTMSNYTVVPNIKTGMIEIRGGSKNGTKLHEYPFDEVDDVIRQMGAATSQFVFMMNNPLLKTGRIDQVISKPASSMVDAIADVDMMLHWYKHALALFSETGAAIHAFLSAPHPMGLDEINDMKLIYDKIDMVVEANKHHLPDSGLARDPQSASTPKHG